MLYKVQKRSSDETRLMITTVAVATAVVIAIISVVALYNDRMLTRAKEASVEQNLHAVGQATAWGVQNWVEGQINLTDAGFFAVTKIANKEERFAVLNQPALTDNFFHVTYGDKDGNFDIAPKRDMPAGYDPRTRAWYLDAADARDVIITDPYVSASTGHLILTIAKPHIVNGAVEGVAGNDVLVDRLVDMINIDQLADIESIFIFNGDGSIIVHKNKQIVGLGVDQLFDGASFEFGDEIQTYTKAGRDKFIKFVKIEGLPAVDWRVGMIADKATVYTDISAFRRSIMAAIAIASVLMILAVGFVTNQLLVRPLVKARKEAEQASISKSEFLASMSHEIRTPMNGVMGMAEILRGTELTEKQATFVDTIHKSGSALTTIINDILDFSKIEAGKMELDYAPFDLRTAVEDVAALLGSSAYEKGVELMVRCHPSLPDQLIGDAGRIRQGITNLVGNAIKFTHEGYVLVDVVCENSGGRSKIRVTVEDTGIGIADDKINQIFEEFTQAEGSTTRKYGGTGLGLSITQSLVKAMGGEIGVESQYGAGSKFWFELDLEITEAKNPAPASSAIDLSSTKILIVDDLDVNREILEELVSVWGARSQSAESAKEAIAMMYEAADAGEPYTLALIDYHMPEMDGADLAKAISESKTLQSTAIIVLSSVDGDGLAGRFRDYGVKEFLTKPIRSSALLSSIGRSVAADQLAKINKKMQKEKLAKSRSGADESDNSKRSILIADDNEVNRMVCQHMIDETQYALTFAHDGRMAYNAFRQKRFDLVLMDISMPEMDGIEALKAIRAYESKRSRGRTPVVAVTAHAMEGDREKLMSNGFDGYLRKPVKKDELNSVIQGWVRSEQKSTATG